MFVEWEGVRSVKGVILKGGHSFITKCLIIKIYYLLYERQTKYTSLPQQQQPRQFHRHGVHPHKAIVILYKLLYWSASSKYLSYYFLMLFILDMPVVVDTMVLLQ